MMELEERDDVVEGEVSEDTLSTDEVAETRQPEQPKKPINLDELDEFKQWKSKMDKELAAIQQQKAQAEAEAARLEREKQQAVMATMSDEEQLRYQLKQTEAKLARMQREAENSQLIAMKEQQLAQIIERTGVPREVISEADSPGAAWAIAVDYMKEHNSRRTKKAVRQERVEENTTDIGSGQPAPSNTVSKKLDKAFKDKDMAAIFAAYTS